MAAGGVMSTEPGTGPTVRRIILGAQLRRLREAVQLSRADAGYTIRASESKMRRLETGQVGFKKRDVAADHLIGVEWRTSSHSGKQGNCVEVASLPDGVTAVRNSRDPCGPALIYPRDETAFFLAAVKDGVFDGRRC